jgi:hypothetical protein
MLRAVLTATAVLCMSQAAFAQEMTAEQRSACKKVLAAAEKK